MSPFGMRDMNDIQSGFNRFETARVIGSARWLLLSAALQTSERADPCDRASDAAVRRGAQSNGMPDQANVGTSVGSSLVRSSLVSSSLAQRRSQTFPIV
jgi:hypothetical protein